MSKLLKNILHSLGLDTLLLNILLNLHHHLYFVISKFAIIENNGKSPKHRIMNYEGWFLDHLNKNSIVLDVGCHHGSFLLRASDYVKFIVGIEIVQKNANKAHLNTSSQNNCKVVCGDATQISFNDYNFDFIILSNVLEHIENRISFLQKISSIHQNASFLIRVPCIDRDWITLFRKERNIFWKLDPTHFTEYTFESFKEELLMANIEIESYKLNFGEIWALCKKSK